LVAAIDRAFTSDHPGDAFLQGSFEGCEPFDEVGAFAGQTDWRALEPAFLDEHASALSFFSEAGLRHYLPAYLVADVRDELQTADPLFHLCTASRSSTSTSRPRAGRSTTVRAAGCCWARAATAR
jgi:hypothetical protein